MNVTSSAATRGRLGPFLSRASSLLATLSLIGALPDAARAQEIDPALVRAQCEAVHQIPDQSIVFGTVTDSRTGLALPGTVHLEWFTRSGIADSAFHTAAAETADGAYIFCDVPQDVSISAYADALGGTSGRREVRFDGGELERIDLELTLLQLRAGLTGRLTDSETEAPVSGATVSVSGTDRTALTDEDGEFTLTNVPVGAHEVVVRHLAYGEPRLGVTLTPDRATHIAATLEPRAIALEPISVEISVRPLWLQSRGFYHRQERSLGQFVTPEMLERRSFARFSEILRDVPGLNVRTICSPRCFSQIGMAGATQSGCLPTFYMDGRPMNVRPAPRTSRFEPRGLIDLDALASPHDLAAVEVYRSIAETPPEFYGRCGSIVIWTKRGIG